MEDGVSGIACGLIFLLRNGFTDGDEEEILKNIDMFIKSKFYTLPDDNFYTGRKGVEFYFKLRLHEMNVGDFKY